MKPWKNLHLKSTIKCFKEVKIDKWPDLSYPFSPIDCCVRINGKPDGLIKFFKPNMEYWLQLVIPKVRYSEGSLFRMSVILKVR